MFAMTVVSHLSAIEQSQSHRVRDAVIGCESHAIVQSQHSSEGTKHSRSADSVPTTMLAALRPWGEVLWTETLGCQRGMINWWCELARSCGDVEAWTQKALVLGDRLLSASIAANEGRARIGLEQQRAMAHLWKESQGFFRPTTAQEFQTCAEGVSLHAAGTSRAWARIAITANSRIASAWVDFWSLPSALEPGNDSRAIQD